eukprot:13785215-Alexandrium_andersonii.AAC.1
MRQRCRAADSTPSSSAPATSGWTTNCGTRSRTAGPGGAAGAGPPSATGGRREQKCPPMAPPSQGAR